MGNDFGWITGLSVLSIVGLLLTHACNPEVAAGFIHHGAEYSQLPSFAIEQDGVFALGHWATDENWLFRFGDRSVAIFTGLSALPLSVSVVSSIVVLVSLCTLPTALRRAREAPPDAQEKLKEAALVKKVTILIGLALVAWFTSIHSVTVDMASGQVKSERRIFGLPAWTSERPISDFDRLLWTLDVKRRKSRTDYLSTLELVGDDDSFVVFESSSIPITRGQPPPAGLEALGGEFSKFVELPITHRWAD